MPSKKKKYNARFPPARIKKIMQTDEDVGKVAAAVPVIISRALELFIESVILKSSDITRSRSAKTLSTAHIKHTILSEKRFDFLKDLVATIPDVAQGEEEGGEGMTSPPAAADPRPPRPPAQRAPRPEGSKPRGRPRKVKPEGEESLTTPSKRPRKKRKREESPREEEQEQLPEEEEQEEEQEEDEETDSATEQERAESEDPDEDEDEDHPPHDSDTDDATPDNSSHSHHSDPGQPSTSANWPTPAPTTHKHDDRQANNSSEAGGRAHQLNSCHDDKEETPGHGDVKDESHVKEESHDNVKEESHGHVKQESHGQVKKESHGKLKQESHGKLKQESHGTLKQESHGNVKQESHGHFKQETHGHAKQETPNQSESSSSHSKSEHKKPKTEQSDPRTQSLPAGFPPPGGYFPGMYPPHPAFYGNPQFMGMYPPKNGPTQNNVDGKDDKTQNNNNATTTSAGNQPGSLYGMPYPPGFYPMPGMPPNMNMPPFMPPFHPAAMMGFPPMPLPHNMVGGNNPMARPGDPRGNGGGPPNQLPPGMMPPFAQHMAPSPMMDPRYGMPGMSGMPSPNPSSSSAMPKDLSMSTANKSGVTGASVHNLPAIVSAPSAAVTTPTKKLATRTTANDAHDYDT